MVAASITPMPHSPPPSATATATATATAAAPTNGPPADPSGPFEGPEKLLELWFKPASPTHSLRSVQRDTWQAILNTVSCTILSVLTHHHQQAGGEAATAAAAAAAADSPPCDAYLLSESSMFVFDHKLILKTCGTTTLLLGLEHILHLAHHVLSGASSSQPSYWQAQAGHTAPDARLGAQLVERVFYSRKSFMFPDRQKGPHKDWILEVALLDDFFTDGAAYTVGKMNGDHWLLYMASQSSAQDAGASSSFSSSSSSTTPRAALSAAPAPTSLTSLPYNDNEDQTLEILMTHLDPAATRAFYFPPLLSQKEEEEEEEEEEQQEEGEQEDKAPPGVAPLPTSADSSSAAGRQFQQATTKGGAASIDEPVDDDEEADPGPGSASAGGAKMANGTVGCAPGSGDEDEGSALEEQEEAEAAAAAASASGQDEDDRGHVLGAQTSAAIGLASLFSSASASSSSEQHQLDAFAFEPCGYSANALIAPSSSSSSYSSSAASEDGEEAGVKHTAGYWTVHVTPEPECSYASFETNVRFLPGSTPASSPSGQEKREKQRQQPHDLASLIRRVVDIFQPGKMSITLFLSSTSEEDKEEAQAQAQVVVVPAAAKAKADGEKEAETNAMALDALVLRGYRRTDRILYEFEGYDLTFVTFERVGLRGAGVGAGAAAVKAVKAA